jgi:hypothetical protein
LERFCSTVATHSAMAEAARLSTKNAKDSPITVSTTADTGIARLSPSPPTDAAG